MHTNKPHIRRIIRTFACQVILFQDTVARRLNLTSSDMKCYNIINSYGVMTPGELARRTGFTTGGITKILDHLEKQDAIARRVESTDRRTLLIEPLTPHWDNRSQESPINFDAIISNMTSQYTEKEFAIIQDFLERSTTLLQKETEQLLAELTLQKKTKSSK